MADVTPFHVPLTDVLSIDRHRTDLGDIAGLATSMGKIGLLQPIVVTPDMRLVAGERRLAAARSLGWTQIEAKVVDNLTDTGALLRAEADENTYRKALTPTEAESIARARQEQLAPLAEQAKAQAIKERDGQGRAVSTGAKLTPVADRKTRQIAADGTGYSASTLHKVREVKELASDETTPEPVREAAQSALANMDRSGKVDGEYKRVKLAEQAAEAKAVTDYLSADASLQLLSWNRNFLKAICRMAELLRFPPQDAAEKATHENLTELREALTQLTHYVERVEALRPKSLRLVTADTPEPQPPDAR